MINPAEKLKAKQQEFISVRELIQRISRPPRDESGADS